MRITRLEAILELQYQIPTLRNRIRNVKKWPKGKETADQGWERKKDKGNGIKVTQEWENKEAGIQQEQAGARKQEQEA